MKGQSKLQSMIEAWVNIIIGYCVALSAQMIVFPLLNIEVSVSQNIKIGLIFTVVSLVRSYWLRRMFNAIHVRQNNGL